MSHQHAGQKGKEVKENSDSDIERIIAIPLFGTRVSPRFDCAGQLLVAGAHDGSITSRATVPSGGRAPLERIKQLEDLKVETLICGGIDLFSTMQLSSRNITILSWVTGEVEDVLDFFLRGELESGAIIGSKGCCRGRWQFRCRNGPPGQK